jgi:hypothetical protein
MVEFIFFEESWNQINKADEICPIHSCLLNEDGDCKKCLEENNK